MDDNHPTKVAFHAKYPDWLHNPQCLSDAFELFEESGYAEEGQFTDLKELTVLTGRMIDIANEQGWEMGNLKKCIADGFEHAFTICKPDAAEFMHSMVYHERLPKRHWWKRKKFYEILFFAACAALGFTLAGWLRQ